MTPAHDADRNYAIARRRMDGAKFREIAEEFGISNARVQQIWNTWKERRRALMREATYCERELCGESVLFSPGSARRLRETLEAISELCEHRGVV